jgi:hypothetical protein
MTRGEVLEEGGCEMTFCPLSRVPSASCAPRVMRSSVLIAGITAEPSGSLATLENRNIAASSDRKNVRAPAKKKFPERSVPFQVQQRMTCMHIHMHVMRACTP